MDKHVNILGILCIVFGGMGLIAAAVVFILLVGTGIASGVASGEGEAMAVLSIIGIIIAGIAIISSLPSLIVGIGLLKYKQWARILGIIVAIINLPGFPVGTAIGIYGLWVLFNDDTIRLFEQGGPAPVQTQAPAQPA